jgi:hypothetical protein
VRRAARMPSGGLESRSGRTILRNLIGRRNPGLSFEAAMLVAAETGMTPIPPYDDLDVIAARRRSVSSFSTRPRVRSAPSSCRLAAGSQRGSPRTLRRSAPRSA